LNIEIELEPFEFIFGLTICSKETGLSEMKIRNRLKQLVEAKLLEKVTGKTTNKYSVYRWFTERFSENNNRQNNKQTTGRQQADNNNQEYKNTDRKKKKKSACAILFNRETSQFENIADTDKLEWQTIYPNVDIDRELLKMRQWLLDPKNPHRDGNRTFVNSWLARSHKIAPSKQQPAEEAAEKFEINVFETFLATNRIDRAMSYLNKFPAQAVYYKQHKTLKGLNT
jgi:hypothetical protein